MKRLTSSEIGSIGESIAVRYLLDAGFQLVQFGKEISSSSQKTDEHQELPVLSDYGVGSSFGSFSLLPSTIENRWQAPVIPSWADLSYDKIKSLAVECSARKVCTMRDGCPASAPCASIDRFLDKDWLMSITPHNPKFVSWNVGRTPVILKGHNLVDICLKRVNRLIVHHCKNDLSLVDSFVVANIVATEYIQRKYWRDSESAKAISISQQPYRSPAGHPGRYDFVGYKDGVHYAIEVKVNSSKPSYWQKIRLGILKKFGFRTLVLHIKLAKSDIDDWKVDSKKIPKISEIYDPAYDDADIPNDEELLAVLNYKARHELELAKLPVEILDRVRDD